MRAAPRTWRFVLMPPQGGTPEMRARVVESRRMIAGRLAGLLEWGAAKRGGPLGLDFALAARLIVAAGEDAARLTLRHPRRYPPERIAALAREGLALLPAGAPTPPSIVAPPSAAGVFPTTDASRRERTSPMARGERREQLLDATLDLLADQGFDALSVEAVARRAGVSRALVYRSFANLGLLLLALMRREDARTRATLDALIPDALGGRPTPQVLAESLATFLDAVMAAPQTYRVVLQRPESAPLPLQKMVNRRRAALAERIRPLVEWGLPGVAVPTEALDVDLVARLLLSSGEELARLALSEPDFPPERVLRGATALLALVPLREE